MSDNITLSFLPAIYTYTIDMCTTQIALVHKDRFSTSSFRLRVLECDQTLDTALSFYRLMIPNYAAMPFGTLLLGANCS